MAAMGGRSWEARKARRKTDAARRRALRAASIPLKGHPRRSPAEVFEAAAAWCRANGATFDVYGTGDAIEAFEADIAERVGFEAARVMPSGTMAQQIALRIWAQRAGRPHVGMHPTSHVELHEERGYAWLHGLNAALVGDAQRPMVAADLAAIGDPLAALLIELPIREAGGQLPPWDDLEALKAAARDRGIPLHLDGARLWSCAPAYDRPIPEITRGFASAYVSLYKGLGAISGAVLLGDRDFIGEARIWQRRHGGTLISQMPIIATAAMQIDAQLAKMPTWLAHARALAAAVGDLDGVRVLPDPPHTHMFHLFVACPVGAFGAARDRVAEAHGIWLSDRVRAADVPGWSRFEVAVHDAALDISPAVLREALSAIARPRRGAA